MPFTRDQQSSEGRWLVVQWGRAAAGPRICLELATALKHQTDIAVSFDLDSDQTAALIALDVPTFNYRGVRRSRSLIARVQNLLLTGARLRRFIRRNHISTVVSCMEGWPQSVIVPFAVPRRVKYVTIIHDPSQHSGEESWLREFGRRNELRRANSVFTMSAFTAEALSTHHGVSPTKLATLFHPRFGDTTVSPRLHPSTVVRVGLFGRLHEYKGIDILLSAAKILRQRGLSIQAVIDGDGPEARWSTTELGNFAEWHVGYVADERLPSVIQGYDIVALPYRDATQSGVIALAIAAGLPVVVTPVGGLPQQVLDTGIGIVAKDQSPEEFAAAIELLVQDADLYERCSKSAVAAANQMTWQSFAEGLVQHDRMSKISSQHLSAT